MRSEASTLLAQANEAVLSASYDTDGDIRFPLLVLLARNSMVNTRLDATSLSSLPVHQTLLHPSLLCTALPVAEATQRQSGSCTKRDSRGRQTLSVTEESIATLHRCPTLLTHDLPRVWSLSAMDPFVREKPSAFASPSRPSTTKRRQRGAPRNRAAQHRQRGASIATEQEVCFSWIFREQAESSDQRIRMSMMLETTRFSTRPLSNIVGWFGWEIEIMGHTVHK